VVLKLRAATHLVNMNFIKEAEQELRKHVLRKYVNLTDDL